MQPLHHLPAGTEPAPSRFARLDEPRYRREIVEQFHYLYYHAYAQTWMQTTWLGVHVHKCPLDLWIYQELLFAEKPDLIIETGSYQGGSALFLATMCDVVGRGRVITIDINEVPNRPEHPRLEYLRGSSTSDAIFAALRERIKPGERILVILDSDHTREHVRAELERFAPLVPPGGHLIVEDTNVNAHPVYHSFGPGPMEAVDEFLPDHPEFSIDRACEKFFLTFNPRGYLKRSSGTPEPVAPRPARPRPVAVAAPDVSAAQTAALRHSVEVLANENANLRQQAGAWDSHQLARAREDADRDRYVRGLEHDLHTIYNSKLWRAMTFYRRFRKTRT